MSPSAKRIRVPAFPPAASLSGAWLEALQEDTHQQRSDLIIDYAELQMSRPPELSYRGHSVRERVRGHYVPRRLRFIKVQALQRTGLYTHLEDVPAQHSARSLRGLVHWRLPAQDTGYLFFNGSDEPAELQFTARRYVAEKREGQIEPVEVVRDWSPAPPIPPRFMSTPRQVHQRYGGDPIAIHLSQRHARVSYSRRLFIGGLDYQGPQRPQVEAILNLGEEPSRWVMAQRHPADRWARKGEGRSGMTVEEIIEEARWVVERLNAGQRVLVHCVAGFNRSVTICCGALILLEKLSAESALARVRQHHPWARPDSHHWLALRWLAQVIRSDDS